MSNSIRIVHLSDLHWRKDNENIFVLQLFEPLLRSLKAENAKRKIDAICITGDLLDKGDSGCTSTAEAFSEFEKNILTKIIEELGIEKKNIILCPGNHDLDIKQDLDFTDDGLKARLNNHQAVFDYMDKIENINFQGMQRMSAFKEFEKKFYQNVENNDSKISYFESVHKRIINEIVVNFTSLNSVWRYYKNEENLILGKNQLINAVQQYQNTDVNILLSHYNVENFANFEKKELEDMISENYQIQLYGHTHSQDAYSKQKASSGVYFIDTSYGLITSNVDSSDKNYQNGYSIIDFYPNNSEIELSLKIYSRKRNEFVNDTDTLGDDALVKFKLRQKGQEELKILHEVSNKISASFMTSINDDLLSHNMNTIAPQNFKDLFVLPRLVDQEKSTKEKEEIVKADHLINNNGNFVIFGSKEIGKTVLLDYIVYALIEKVDSIKKIPVFIDYSQKKKSTPLKTCIQRFTGIDLFDVSDFAKKNGFVLLIDNYNCTDKNFAEELIDFTKNHPNVSFIATIKTEYSQSIPVEFFDNPLYNISKIFKLKYFNTAQITDLTSKWYSKNTYSDKKNKKDKIIKIITSLELPRTPLAISMFLWIFEKQEGYQPVNQATMLENFIEKMFKKHDERAQYSEFDYKNKEKLLSAIALKMYRSQQKEYALKYQDLVDFISGYLKKREFDFCAKDILDEFIDVTLFKTNKKYQDTLVSFRFNCFFQYFLMKNLDDTKFRSEIITPQKYLSFSDEINLYTGLKRDCKDILNFVVLELENIFQEIREFVAKAPSFDVFFETTSSLTEKLGQNSIKIIENEKPNATKKMDVINDQLLEDGHVGDEVAEKRFNLTKGEQLELSLILAANVLRNSEEIDIDNIKYDFFVKILHASLVYVCFYKYKVFLHYLGNKSPEKKDEAKIFMSLLPVLNETLLEDILGTSKLNNVVKKHIDKIIDDKEVTQLEKFCTVFLYLDFKENERVEVLKKYIKNLKGNYIRDMVLLKLVSYYFTRTSTKPSDLDYENLIADLINFSKEFNKSRIMEFYRKKKDKYVIESKKDSYSL